MPNRLGLARWLVSPENPLTARVDRQPRLGAVLRPRPRRDERGLRHARAPRRRHPELLDWLATEFVRQKWSLKALHRLIVTSATYRQSAAGRAGAARARSRTTGCSRAARASAWRPRWSATRRSPRAGCSARRSAGRASSRCSRTASGTIPYSDAKWDDERRRGPLSPRPLHVHPADVAVPEPARRSTRTSREFCTVRRVRTNTPLQALADAERRGVLRGGAGARRAHAATLPAPGDAADALTARAAYGFRLCTSRRPAPEEAARIVASYARAARRRCGRSRSGAPAHREGRRGRRRTPRSGRRGRSSRTRS